MRLRAQRQAFVRQLETMTDGQVWHLLTAETDEELCALVEFASARLKEIILRRLRVTED